jgi:surfactin synthase thioesterase subunit
MDQFPPRPVNWFLRPAPRSTARVTLYCFPHAGGNASAYRAWPGLLPDEAEVVAVRLPGRESRVAEQAVVDPVAVAEAIRGDCGRRPYALFGHSMGGLLAFEVARLLSADGARPLWLAVSGSPHPLARTAPPPVSGLPVDELLAWLRGTGAVPEAMLSDPDHHDALLPPLRADCHWLESYAHRRADPLHCGITALAGATDPDVTEDGLLRWAQETTGPFVPRRYPGGHFYLADRLPDVVSDLAGDLLAALGLGPVGAL